MIDKTRQSLTRFQSRYELDFSIQLQIDGAIDIAVIYLPRLRSTRNAIHSLQYAIALQLLMQLIGVIETGRQSETGRELEGEKESSCKPCLFQLAATVTSYHPHSQTISEINLSQYIIEGAKRSDNART